MVSLKIADKAVESKWEDERKPSGSEMRRLAETKLAPLSAPRHPTASRFMPDQVTAPSFRRTIGLQDHLKAGRPGRKCAPQVNEKALSWRRRLGKAMT
jgi:hypothetical protein